MVWTTWCSQWCMKYEGNCNCRHYLSRIAWQVESIFPISTTNIDICGFIRVTSVVHTIIYKLLKFFALIFAVFCKQHCPLCRRRRFRLVRLHNWMKPSSIIEIIPRCIEILQIFLGCNRCYLGRQTLFLGRRLPTLGFIYAKCLT